MIWEKIWEFTLNKEGGYQNLPDDTANYCDGKLIGTKFGISAIAYKSRYGYCPSIDQIKNLTEDQARDIAYYNYFIKSGAYLFKNDGVKHLVFQEFFGSGYAGMKRVRKAINKTANKELLEVNNNVFSETEVQKVNLLNQRKLFNNIWETATEFRSKLPYANSYLKRWYELKLMYPFVFDFVYLVYGVLILTSGYLLYKMIKK